MPRQSFAFRPGSVLLHHYEADERRTAQASRIDARSLPGKNGDRGHQEGDENQKISASFLSTQSVCWPSLVEGDDENDGQLPGYVTR